MTETVERTTKVEYHAHKIAQSCSAFRAMFICQSWQFLAKCFLPFLAIFNTIFGNFKGVYCRLCTNECQNWQRFVQQFLPLLAIFNTICYHIFEHTDIAIFGNFRGAHCSQNWQCLVQQFLPLLAIIGNPRQSYIPILPFLAMYLSDKIIYRTLTKE